MTLEPDTTTIVVLRNVPAQVCPNCGEAYTDEVTTTRLLEIAEDARRSGIQVDIRQYRAA